MRPPRATTVTRWWQEARIPLLMAIAGGIVSVMVSAISQYNQAKLNNELERDKARAQLVLEIVKTGDIKRSSSNLQFLLKAKLLDDPQGYIEKALSEGFVPVLPEQGRIGDIVSSLPKNDRAFIIGSAVGTLVRDIPGNKLLCSAIAIGKNQILTESSCLSTKKTELHATTFFIRGTDHELVQREIDLSRETTEIDSIGVAYIKPELPADLYLSNYAARAPKAGEAVMLFASPAKAVSEVSRSGCYIVDVGAANFTYKCKSAPGTAGGVVVALSDFAFLGIHYAVLEPGTENESKLARRLYTASP